MNELTNYSCQLIRAFSSDPDVLSVGGTKSPLLEVQVEMDAFHRRRVINVESVSVGCVVPLFTQLQEQW